MILSIDPGDTSGWALWTNDMEPISEGQGNLGQINDLLIEHGRYLEVIIYEDFIGYQNKVGKMAGSRFVASQVIGAIKLISRMYGAETARQPAAVLGVAAMHSGRKQPTNHKLSHVVDAYNHGHEWGVKQGLLKTQLQKSATI